MKNTAQIFTMLACLTVSAIAMGAEKDVLAKLPVREVTVFKDGHAFVLHEGTLAADAKGDVVLDELPRPVIGTFWAYAVGGKLRGALASRQAVTLNRPALNLAEMIKANIGAEVTFIDGDNRRVDAKILAVPQPEPEDGPEGETSEARYRRLESLSNARGEQIVWLETKEGTLVRRLNMLSQVIFKTPPRATLVTPDFKNLLRLQLEKPPAPGQKANVGMVYLQKGLRWIPSYRISLGKDGKAGIKMQATLANELVDLENATANLVIGVPSFAFRDSVDPISLQNDFARLSPLFGSDTRSAGAFSNSLMSQVASNRGGNSYALERNTAQGDVQPLGGTKNEDFFVFSIKNVSLAKGERMTFLLADYNVPFRNIYTSETPATPPVELYDRLSSDQQRAANLAPAVMHKLRISNSSAQPFTTAPTLLESGGRLLAQTLMTYTAPGGRSDIDLAPAVDVTVKRRESEIKRIPGAMRWQNDDFARVDVSGRLLVTSYRNEPITLELSQQFLGTVDSAGLGGEFRKLGLGDDRSDTEGGLPAWWNSNGGGWQGLNGLSAANWTIQVPAKGKVEVPYSYHYFWR